ncbi:DUF1761 domain-containing protein [Alkalicaulis satelles]|uniref:DUF1761 domain-containing protein n=1 Tax=Alkalicaulis satelles TaxID=2609175 RepID=A0A5M6ZIY8_9PROT|nr:DUF1761 domain-containing protein [Alkalicaulis satelles]KAA5804749.1 DUF1761 domain-containing protein [Alkalicaulis satelles]
MPRIFGHDLLAFIAAVIAFYAVGFVIYGLVFNALWMSLAGYSPQDFAGHEWKIVLGPVMPILIVTGLAFMLQASRRSNLTGHVSLGFAAWLFFMLPSLMYGYAYGVNYPLGLLVMDGGHLLAAALIASAILVWRKVPKAA